MRKVLHIARNDLRLFLVQRGNLVGLLLTPVLMTVIIGLVNGGVFDQGPGRFLVDVVDQDQSRLSGQLVELVFESNPNLALCTDATQAVEECALEEAGQWALESSLERLKEGTVRGVLVIPAGFESMVAGSQEVEIAAYTKGDVLLPEELNQPLQTALEQLNGSIAASRVGLAVILDKAGPAASALDADWVQQELYAQAVDLWGQEPVRVHYTLTAQDETNPTVSALQTGLGHSVPGMGGMFMMMTVLGGMTTLMEERRQWTLQRVACMPISRAQLLAGKILARFSLGVLQYAVVFLVGILLGMQFGENYLGLLLTVIVFTLAVTAMSFAIGPLLRNEVQANGVALLLSITLAPLGGAWWPMEIVPEFMRIAGHVSPVAWAMDSFRALIFESGSVPDVLLPLGVLLGLGLLFFGFGIRSFRYD